jgi:hypothetical protein
MNPQADQKMAAFCNTLTNETEYIAQSDDRRKIRRAIQMLTTGPGETCANIHNLIIQVADEQNGLDRALIQLTRSIIYQYIAANRDSSFDEETTIQQMFETYSEKQKTFEQQLSDIIIKSPVGMGIDASDQLVSSGLPFQAFRVQCDVITPMAKEHGAADYRTERINPIRYPVATVALICKHVHYDIAYGRRMDETEKLRMNQPEQLEGMTEADQPNIEEDIDNSILQSSSSSLGQHYERPHEASAQQNNNYLEPGD